MRSGFISVLFLILLSASSVSAQKIGIYANNDPLNKILLALRDRYHLEFSFNDQLLSQFKLTVNQNFDSPEEAIMSLIKGLPLTLAKRREVFMILPEKKEMQPKNYLLSGSISEARSDEPLSFSQLIIDNRVLISDMKGSFSYAVKKDSSFRVKVVHLGYYILDTVLVAGINHHLKLLPSIIGLREIVIWEKSPDRTTQVGNVAGSIRLNHQISRYLPGNNDNSIFTLLRLMPGILASSEQSNGLIIWGSYEGQSQIMLDGFNIWGLKSFNDDIDAVNPLIAKDVEVFKGGFDATLGDRVGGIVRINGKTANMKKPSISLNINNVTANGMVELPLWKNSSLLLSFRQTYYNLYNNKKVIPHNVQNYLASKPTIDYTVFPDYNYRDANIKFTTTNNKGDLFYISSMAGDDRFKYTIDQRSGVNSLFKTNSEKNDQYGLSSFFGHRWKNGNMTNLTTTYSALDTEIGDVLELERPNGSSVLKHDNSTRNKISEISGRIDNNIKLSQSHILETGFGFAANDVSLTADSSGFRQTNFQIKTARINGYAQDHLTLAGQIDLKLGLRADLPFNLVKLYVQPRISASFRLSDKIKLNAAWGIYNQFISKSSVLDETGNYKYIWTACDNENVPVLKSIHWVLGSTYNKNDLTFSIEAYYKQTDGLTRFIKKSQKYKNLIYKGDGRDYGIDFFLRKDYRGHSAWISYTLSKSEERFPYFTKGTYRPSPMDQRHEVKTAVIVNLKPLFLSANYVFGSGFLFNNGTSAKPIYISPKYNRLDVAVNVRFNIGKTAGETGVSILNVLDTKNIRYANFEKVPVDQTISVNVYQEAVPFSPRVNLRLVL